MDGGTVFARAENGFKTLQTTNGGGMARKGLWEPRLSSYNKP